MCGGNSEAVKRDGAIRAERQDHARIKKDNSYFLPYSGHAPAVILLPILGVLYKNKVR